MLLQQHTFKFGKCLGIITLATEGSLHPQHAWVYMNMSLFKPCYIYMLLVLGISGKILYYELLIQEQQHVAVQVSMVN